MFQPYQSFEPHTCTPGMDGHTGWCILSRTTVIPHMVHQGDAPGYYLYVILLIWNILTRTTEIMSMTG